MKANELRIDNWCWSSRNESFQVNADDILILARGIAKEKIRYKPIPLTSDWLEKFGIREFSLGQVQVNNTYESFYQTDLYIDGKIFDIKTYHLIEFVHQLQNLYHALTGEELTIKQLVT